MPDFKKVLLFLGVFFFAFTNTVALADEDRVSLFPLNNYDQVISNWIKPTDPGFNKVLLTKEIQQKRFAIFYDHYFGSFSPWSADHVNRLLSHSPPDDLKTIERDLIAHFSNQGKPDNEIGYGENFRPHDQNWIDQISNSIRLSQFEKLTYQQNRRGIAIDNLYARALPTDDVHFYSYKLAGQGYPFDNLQISALWAGTPVYIVGETRDHAWVLVITPEYVGWVKSKGIARVNNLFASAWTKAAKNKLIAITRTKTTVVDKNGRFLFLAYVGSVFPGSVDSKGIRILAPTADINGNAVIKKSILSSDSAAVMPLPATPRYFSDVMSTMIGRPYGWGGLYFYNDCSAELKNLLTPFGIWLPRHSSDQVTVGKIVDISSFPEEKRLAYLIKNGQPFLTIVYVGAHVVMYIGNYPDPHKTNAVMAMTYQAIWGLRPSPPIRRAVIGKSVLFPMLLQYPEDTSLMSLANKKYFQVSYLNQFPDSGFFLEKWIDLKSLMYPETLLSALSF